MNSSYFILFLSIITALSLLRDMNSLRFTSLLGFSMAIYLVSVVTIEYFVCSLWLSVCVRALEFHRKLNNKQLLCADHEVVNHYDTACIWSANYSLPLKAIWPLDTFKNFYSGFLTAFPLVIFSYTGHPFMMPLYVELARPSMRRMRKVFKRGYGIITVLYSLVTHCCSLCYLFCI